MGEAVKASGVPREELFITTKLPYVLVKEAHALPRELTVLRSRPHHCGRVKEFFEDSLKSLGVDYVDLVCAPSPTSRFVAEACSVPDPPTRSLG